MLHIVLLHCSNHLYLLASCKGLIFVYKPSSALGKTLFLLIMFLSTINCLSCTINCVHSFIQFYFCSSAYRPYTPFYLYHKPYRYQLFLQLELQSTLALLQRWREQGNVIAICKNVHYHSTNIASITRVNN